ncbi:hypothetical protein ABZY81_38425 [Streptomyces sp. NPDC006514]|uniref:hypothetical protein n=1 Tax=Streptomyces sp. NPDC006514 TaxID=3154308 RepID=UPI0033BD726E
MDILAALCDILQCTPNDLIKPEVVNAVMRKTADSTPAAVPLSDRRAVIRRPGQP